MGPSPSGRGVTMIGQALGRLIGLLVLCLLVGLLLTHLGIAARGILTDTWHTIELVFRLIGNLVEWAVPYALLGAIVVVPVVLVELLLKRGLWRR